MFNIEGEELKMRIFTSSIILFCSVLYLSGCVNVDLKSMFPADGTSEEIVEVRYNYWTGEWRKGKSPQTVFNSIVQKESGGDIDRRAISHITVTRSWKQSFDMIASFGMYSPVTVQFWFTRKPRANIDCKNVSLKSRLENSNATIANEDE